MDVTKLWASHGLNVGKQVLETSAKSLSMTAEVVDGDPVTRLQGGDRVVLRCRRLGCGACDHRREGGSRDLVLQQLPAVARPARGVGHHQLVGSRALALRECRRLLRRAAEALAVFGAIPLRPFEREPGEELTRVQRECPVVLVEGQFRRRARRAAQRQLEAVQVGREQRTVELVPPLAGRTHHAQVRPRGGLA